MAPGSEPSTSSVDADADADIDIDADEPTEDLTPLVARATAGDMDAFTELVEITRPAVRATVASSVRGAPDIEDLVQEVYLRAMVALRSLDQPDRFRSWLYAIARNAATDFHRRAQRRPSDPVDHEQMDVVDDREVDTETLVELAQLAETVRMGLGRLSPLDATLVAMVGLLGFTPTNIAESLGMTPNAAKVAVHRARKRLREAMLVQNASGSPRRPCDEFQQLIDAGELVPAAVHARGCSLCATRPT